MWEELGFKYLVNAESWNSCYLSRCSLSKNKVIVGFHTYYLHLFVSVFFCLLICFVFCCFFFSCDC